MKTGKKGIIITALVKQLKKDELYRDTWKANIAMAFKDEAGKRISKVGWRLNSKDIHQIATKAAGNFLELLCDEIKCPEGR